MQLKVINPYAFIGTKHKETLDFIGNNLPVDPTFEQLNEVLVAGSFTADPDHLTISGFAATFAATILPNAYNGYVNGNQLTIGNSQLGVITGAAGTSVRSNTPYTETQQKLIDQLLRGISSVSLGDLVTFLEQQEENIVKSGLTYEEQLPLFLAIACAKADAEYWYNQITTPGIWAAYFDANPAINYLYLPGVVSASVQGVLLTYGLMKKPEIGLLDVYVSLIGATGLAAGKVVFGWLGK
jgi:hypothetical protein